MESLSIRFKSSKMYKRFVDSPIYVIGGVDNSWTACSTVEVYDPATDKWSKKENVPTPRAQSATSALGGKIYAIGGKDAGFWGIFSVEVYDAATDKWEKKADMPTARGFLSSAVVNGKIYAIGGGTGGGNCAPLKEGVVEEYDTGFVPKGVDAKGKLPTTCGKIKHSR